MFLAGVIAFFSPFSGLIDREVWSPKNDGFRAPCGNRAALGRHGRYGRTGLVETHILRPASTLWLHGRLRYGRLKARLAFPCLGVENFLSPTISSTGKSGPFLIFAQAVAQPSVLAET